jgi:WD40 repeat protein/tRNA A-37 threonylcarbamoyl transferase component Bud32
MSRSHCLTQDELTAFHLGELAPTAVADLAAHLEGCTRCEAAARELDGLCDPLVDAYRRSALAGRSAMPRQVGDYEILEEVGRGGMGVVFRARHRQLHRVVALKMLLEAFAASEERARFAAEAEAVARLHHPNIVQIYDVGEYTVQGRLSLPFLALEFVDGNNLAAHAAGRPQRPRQAASWVETLARAMHYAHSQGIIHRDLKPSNVLLTADGQPKICDFGVAKFAASSGMKTRSGMLVGTAEFMAPEQALGDAPVGPPADIYALGAILYTLLTGRPPFQGVSPLHTLEQVRREEPVTPGRLQPRIPRDLETICLKCLEKAPVRRYGTAGEFADDLERFLRHEPIRARRASMTEVALAWARRHKTLALALGAVMLSLSAAAAFASVAAVQKEAERRRARDAESAAIDARRAAEAERDRALGNLYIARTNLTGQAVDAPSGMVQVAQLFAEWRGRDLRSVPRGWEWFYYLTLAGRSELTLRGHVLDVAALAWSPDGARLATGGFDRSIRLWDAATGKQVAAFLVPGGVLGLGWRPDGRRLASADYPSRSVSIWDPATGTLARTLTGHKAEVWTVSWNPDGRRLASADRAGRVIIWKENSDRPILELNAATETSGCAAWSPDGRRLAAPGRDATVTIWDATSGKSLITLSGHKFRVVALAWDASGALLATLSADETIVIWSAATGAKLRLIEGPRSSGFPGLLAWSPDGRRLAVGQRDLTVALWDVETGQQGLLLRGHTGSQISAVCWKPDGERLATAQRGWNGTVKIWRTDAMSERPFQTGDGPAVPTDICWSPDSRSLATGHEDGTVKIWDAATHERLATLRSAAVAVSRVRWCPNGALLAGGDQHGMVYVWDVARRQVRDTLRGDGQPVASLSWSQDSARLAFGTNDSGVFTWDVATGARKPLGRRGIGGVLRPQGDRLAMGESYGIKIVDAKSGAEVRSWRNVEVTDNDPRWDPTGLRVASRSDFAVEVRDATTAGLPFPPLAHLRHVENFAWSPDGRQLVTCTEDNDLHLWDAVEGNPILTLRGPAQQVIGLAWSPDGTRIVVCARDGKIAIWDATPGYASERAPALLEALNTRLAASPQDREALALRAGIHARRGAWDAAAADAARLAAAGATAVFQAGWWVADVPRPASASVPLADPFSQPLERPAAAPRWYISPDDPNGYVPLHREQACYFTRLYVPRAQALAVALEADPKLDASLWLRGNRVDSPQAATLMLSAGWNTVMVRLEEREPPSSVLLRHGIGFYLRLRP